ncbi:MAG: hypothetical protein HZB52_09290, partial [Chloroflexi bacterium]|nr:hypothetical protein [Chloroflexota bacterium]
MQATALGVTFAGLPGLTLEASNMSLESNNAADDGTLVNYAAQPLTVPTGTGTNIILNMDATQGELLRAAGHLKLNVFNFYQVEGDFAFEESLRTVSVYKDDGDPLTTDDHTDVAVEMLTLGGHDVTSFVGMNGGTANALGLSLTGVDFAIAFLSELASDEREWVSLQATAATAAFVGITGLTLSGDTLSIEINQAASDGSLVDYATQALTVKTGPSTDITFNMDATDDELLRASGNLNINLFDFFQVSGGFALEKKIETVMLSDGKEAEVDLLTIGASGVNAFAGLRGGSLDALGLNLSNVNFALALMTDREDEDRKFASLQATVGSASIVGIDGLIVNADTLEVLINHGIEVAAKAPSSTTTNALYLLNISADTIGTLTFDYNGNTQDLILDGSETDTTLHTNLTSTLEALTGIGAGNVLVTGDKAGGFVIEFMGALAGTDVAGLTVSTVVAAAHAVVEQIRMAEAGVDEIKRITIETTRAVPPHVTSSVTQITAASSGTGGGKIITFTMPYNSKGTFDIVVDGVVKSNVTFGGSMTLVNQTRIRAGLATALGGNINDITVKFDQKSVNEHRYFINFRGGLVTTDTNGLRAAQHFNVGNVIFGASTGGTSPTGETQRVQLTSSTSGEFTLTLNHDGTAYTTTGLSFNADASTVEASLNAALMGVGDVTVSGTAGNWQVTFGGDLIGQDVSLLKVKVAPVTSAPTGTFDVTYDGSATWETVTYSDDTTTMATNIQTALTNLFGAGVTVNYENGGNNFKNYRVNFSGALANQNIADLIINWSHLVDATAKPYNIKQGQAGVAEAQRVELTTDAATGDFTLEWTHNGTTYTTAAIAFDATQTDVQHALDVALSGLAGALLSVTFWNGHALEVEFGGSLAGVNVDPLVATVTPTATAATLSQTQTGSTVNDPGHPKYTLVVDYDPTNLVIPTGPSTSFTMNIDGAKGEYLLVTGNATFSIGSLVTITGSFGFEKSSGYNLDIVTNLNTTLVNQNPTLKASLDKVTGITPDYTRIEALPLDGILFSAVNADIFIAGSTADSALFAITGITFGLGLFSSNVATDPDRVVPNLYAFKATIVSPLDLDLGILVIDLDALTVRVNGGDDWAGGTLGAPYIDFVGSPDGPVTIATGGDPVVLDFSTSVIGVELGHAFISLADFIVVEASNLLIEQQQTTVDVMTGFGANPADAPPSLQTALQHFVDEGYLSATDYSRFDNLPVNLTRLSASNVNVFVGGTTSSSSIFSLTNIDFALAIIKSTTVADPSQIIPRMFALNVNWPAPLSISWGGLVLDVASVAVEVNKGNAWNTGAADAPAPFVDFVSSFGAAGLNLTSNGSLVADYDHALTRVTLGHVLIQLFDFVHLEGDSFTFEKGTSIPVDVATGFNLTTIQTAAPNLVTDLQPFVQSGILSADYTLFTDLLVDRILIGAQNVRLFVGSGPYFMDRNGDGIYDDAPDADALGFALSHLNLALAIFNPSDSVDPNNLIPNLYALKANATDIGLVGLDFLTLQASAMLVALNQGGLWVPGKTLRPYINFKKSFETAPDANDGVLQVTPDIAFDYAQSALEVQVSNAQLSIGSFVYLYGDFAFKKGGSEKVTLNVGPIDVPDVDVNVITLGGSNIQAFVGINGPYRTDTNGDTLVDANDAVNADAMGFVIDDLSFALAMMKPTSAPFKSR